MAIVQEIVPGWPVISQDPDVARGAKKVFAERNFLPELIRAWQHIEGVTGYRWKSTSYWRRSPSHRHGVALDIAPDISPDAEKFYAVNNGSDPVLYKREKLLRDLQLAAETFKGGKYQVNVFIEPDHLHMQVMKYTSTDDRPMAIIKWKVPKPIYGDTFRRMKLPIIKKGM
jgi:hypothetical protein